jgi:hypothetical protein
MEIEIWHIWVIAGLVLLMMEIKELLNGSKS